MRRCIALLLSIIMIIGMVPAEPVFGYEEIMTADETLSEVIEVPEVLGQEEGFDLEADLEPVQSPEEENDQFISRERVDITNASTSENLYPDGDGEGDFPPANATVISVGNKVTAENVSTVFENVPK
ncbi:MAG: hypothetical protein K6F28_00005 [Lachnospiraceae bacterium]|nr:hypothetical protein [Lachnospiraceae bacterium]